MTYKPPVQQSAGKGPTGKAKVQINTKGDKVKVVLHEETKDGETKTYEAILDKENCPECVRAGTWFVSLSSDLKKMYSIRPINEMVEGHVKNFAASKDKAPAPKMIPGKFGEYPVFYVILEILSDNAKGMTVSYQLPYNFVAMEQEVKGTMQEVVGFSHAKSAFTAKLVEFLEVTGAWKRGAIAYSDNILPKLEKRILEADEHFKWVMKNGYVDTIYAKAELPESEDVEDTKADENPAF